MDIRNGVFPTMITPFNEKKEIDYTALREYVEWLIGHGVQGLFAVCQSSEMFALSLEERVQLAKFVTEKAAGRVQVIASGHISDTNSDQIEEIRRISSTRYRCIRIGKQPTGRGRRIGGGVETERGNDFIGSA
ncbi:dihydrodipicolinate synthase family protein [Paenibacillus sp. D2_2]|uniref:dihydrodipicolinate synthase family protein n=1 Tax=Paenibacillus sp. D2_2 TaxID=3073092 RepID=UPI0028164DCA|nr:dihydrodipicolinate synthase family protein [Paenibacillus sp. D2_2]WMT39712.1 dihydrodipicolinate synthase family protein [Paenibacillus sp. D2_2]